MTTYKYSNPDTLELVADISIDDPEIISVNSEEVQNWLAAGNKILPCTPGWSWKQIRKRRNQLLTDTDWWVLPDRTPTQAQLDYRQALRDITDTYLLPDDVVWPEKPE